MRKSFCCLVGVLAWLMMPAAAVAQQGHPLAGVWLGDWGPSAKERHPVVIELTWENTTLGGIINPGEADAAPLKVGRLDSTKWTVHLEGEAMEGGKPVRIVVDGQLENLGSAKRSISGTWTRGTTKGTFKVTRD
jgi:hypothetical protein